MNAVSENVGNGRNRLRRMMAVLGPFLALIAIVLIFGLAIQVKSALDQRSYLQDRAEKRAALGMEAEPMPSFFELFRRQENNFLSVPNFRNVANQTVAVGIAAMGMTMIIIAAGIDLSVGSVIALSSVVTALCLSRGWSPLPAALMGVLTGAGCGLLNALLITRLKVVPFIATLGMLGAARGLAEGAAREQKIDAPSTWLGEYVLVTKPTPEWLIVSPGIWTMLIVAGMVAVLLRYTALGKSIFAIGSNEAAARLCGIPIERAKLLIYSIAGLTTGLAGVMQFSRLTVGDPTTAIGTELDVIAAVVIGGGSLNGGEGSVIGSLVGAFIMAFLRAGCDQIGIPNWVQKIIIGAVIVLAVALDQLRHARTSK
jgi:ribose/xylose/arabinose/galactoside ABC-type transport system permease subunit